MVATFLSKQVNNFYNEKWPAKSSVMARAFEKFCNFVFKYYCPLSVYKKEDLPKKPFLICSNHQSHMDSTIIMAATKLDFKKIGLLAAKDYFFDQPNMAFVRSMLNLIPIVRGSGGKALNQSIEGCKDFLKSGGQVLIIYPEGTRSLDGKIAAFKQGASILAHELDLVIVPTYVEGALTALPKGSHMIRPAKITVSFGKSLKVADFIKSNVVERKDLFEAYRACTFEIQKRVLALQEERQRHEK